MYSLLQYYYGCFDSYYGFWALYFYRVPNCLCRMHVWSHIKSHILSRRTKEWEFQYCLSTFVKESVMSHWIKSWERDRQRDRNVGGEQLSLSQASEASKPTSSDTLLPTSPHPLALVILLNSSTPWWPSIQIWVYGARSYSNHHTRCYPEFSNIGMFSSHIYPRI